MRIEEVINTLEHMTSMCDAGATVVCDKWIEAAMEAVTLLKVCQEAKPNEPLTLEELRKMDGRPVFVKHLSYPDYSAWWIIGWVEKECILASARKVNRGYTAKSYGEYWIAYRRPPKEEQR